MNDPFTFALQYLMVSAVAGVAGAFAMNGFMRLVTRSGEVEVNMIEALASLFTGRLDNALRVGTAIHLGSGVFFGLVYALLMIWIQPGGLPRTLFLGLGFGFFHGLLVAYFLMFMVAERHPIEKYRKATFSVGLVHLIGHVVYGAVVGLIIGLVPALTTG